MNLQAIRNQLTTLKIHIDQVDDWVRQATDIVYQIEENLFDYEDGKVSKNNFMGYDAISKVLMYPDIKKFEVIERFREETATL